jgi:hypothetical protein
LTCGIVYNAAVPTEPVEYREPQAGDDLVVRRARARRAIWAGVWGIVVSAALMTSPIFTPKRGIEKYMVAAGFLGVCWGLSCLMHGAWDWWRGK